MESAWMKLLNDTSTALFFLAFFTPGFVAYKTYDVLAAGERRDFSKAFLEILGVSGIFFAFTAPLLGLVLSMEASLLRYLCLVLLAFVMPAIIAIAWFHFPAVFANTHRRLVRNANESRGVRARPMLQLVDWLNRVLPIRQRTPTAWDTFFSRRTEVWVILTFKDGAKLCGLYDNRASASSFPHRQQLYLSQVYKLNESGIPSEKVEGSAGALIDFSEVKLLEFLNVER